MIQLQAAYKLSFVAINAFFAAFGW
jgi:hypothetical protein